MSYFQRLIVNTLTFVSMAVIFPNMVFVSGFGTAIIASFVLSLLNMLVKPVLTILSLPFTLITFGLFSFVVNAAMLQLTSFFVGSAKFGFATFGASILVAIVMSIVNSIVSEHTLSKYQDEK
ncbi:putative membrane protein [Enterococcus sp. PF1-24]|uniref:phage holin family protein n=1 Tax=unclassified Enterococcus TaxID=2608891 RepID=UPI002475E881|nr:MULTISPECIES: phage holin family protein [unclassified Enterococcus]MDH6363348.1 putative membrane protein [Enterococcus sp. PFB1-1]MDH6400351.1 putative membrane protein [Enterococcus sp. PF1-24]